MSNNTDEYDEDYPNGEIGMGNEIYDMISHIIYISLHKIEKCKMDKYVYDNNNSALEIIKFIVNEAIINRETHIITSDDYYNSMTDKYSTYIFTKDIINISDLEDLYKKFFEIIS